MGFRSSGGRTNIENTLGFVGKYQFGTAALEDLGFIKKGTFKGTDNSKIQNGLSDDNNWSDPPGSKEAFLNNPEIQEEAMRKLVQNNCNTMRRLGVIDDNTTPQEAAGFIAAAHLGGPGGAKALKEGKNRSDAYGGGTGEYFRLGANSITEPTTAAA